MWQRLTDETGLQFVSVAVDMQGPDVVRPWTVEAQATFTTLLDRTGLLPARLGLGVVPVLLVFEDGRLVQPASPVNVLRDEQREAVRSWARHGTPSVELPSLPQREGSSDTEAALAWLEVARFALEEGRPVDALASLERGFEHDPDNWLIRKQRWALREPERFYDGEIDIAWQAEQQAAGR